MFIGIDIGGTSIKYGVVSEQGEIIAKDSIPTVDEKEQLISELVKIIRGCQKKYKIIGVGICAPGIIQKNGLMVTAGAIISLYSVNLKQEIERYTDLPVTLDNDANAAAIAEHWLGSGKEFNDYLFVALGTGVGGGLVLNGEIYRGAHGLAGEFGWMMSGKIPEDCDIEEISFNKRVSVVDGLCYQYNKEKKSLDSGFREINDAEEIFAKAKTGDNIARTVINKFYKDLSMMLINLLSCFDPETIIIGGGISANDEFVKRLKKEVNQIESGHSAVNRVKDSLLGDIRIAHLKNDAGLLGAVYQVSKIA